MKTVGELRGVLGLGIWLSFFPMSHGAWLFIAMWITVLFSDPITTILEHSPLFCDFWLTSWSNSACAKGQSCLSSIRTFQINIIFVLILSCAHLGFRFFPLFHHSCLSSFEIHAFFCFINTSPFVLYHIIQIDLLLNIMSVWLVFRVEGEGF